MVLVNETRKMVVPSSLSNIFIVIKIICTCHEKTGIRKPDDHWETEGKKKKKRAKGRQ